MPKIKILTETDLRALVPLDLEAIDCVERAFVALAGGKVVMPPILSMAIHDYNGEVDVKTAYVPGIDSFAIKMSPGFFDNPKLGLPSTSGLMVLFSSRTGVLEALLLDNGYLTDIRTAAAGAVAARHLSRPDASRACILGAGAQARLQLKALSLVRPITEATIWARDPVKAQRLAEALSSEWGYPVHAAADLEAAVSQADVIVTTTPSSVPLVMAEWLRPGQHVTAMGSTRVTRTSSTRPALGAPISMSPTAVRKPRYWGNCAPRSRLVSSIRTRSSLNWETSQRANPQVAGARTISRSAT